MEINSIYDFFNRLKDDSLSFLYHGFMSDEFTEKIISLSEKNIALIPDSKSIQNKISFLIAESFQNIVRHGKSFDFDKEQLIKPGVFMYRIFDEDYIISSANLVNNNNIENITKKISQINNLDKEQLKSLYYDVLNKMELSEKGGAGLGLIEMARKTGNKLDFDFERVDEINSFFYLQMKFISKSTGDKIRKEYPIKIAKEFCSIINEKNTYLTYKGVFTQENVLILLKIIERNLQINQFEHESTKSLIYIILTELLQNISKHAYSIDNVKVGVFSIGRYSHKYVLSTGNFIENNKVPLLKQKIDFLTSKSKEELQKVYMHKIRNGEMDELGNAGLGFIEIAKECDEINYDISKVNEEYCFITMSINF